MFSIARCNSVVRNLFLFFGPACLDHWVSNAGILLCPRKHSGKPKRQSALTNQMFGEGQPEWEALDGPLARGVVDHEMRIDKTNKKNFQRRIG